MRSAAWLLAGAGILLLALDSASSLGGGNRVLSWLPVEAEALILGLSLVFILSQIARAFVLGRRSRAAVMLIAVLLSIACFKLAIRLFSAHSTRTADLIMARVVAGNTEGVSFTDDRRLPTNPNDPGHELRGSPAFVNAVPMYGRYDYVITTESGTRINATLWMDRGRNSIWIHD
jgi:hypothetical protein